MQSDGGPRDGYDRDRYTPPQALVPTSHDEDLQSFHYRLAENERAQKELAGETARLQGRVQDAFRFHEDMLRDEAHLRRVFEDHSRFFETVVGHMQSQLSAMSQQLALEREAAYRSIEMARQGARDQAELADSLRNEVRAAMRETEAIRAAVEAQASGTAEGIGSCMARCGNLERALGEFHSELTGVGGRLAEVAGGFARSLEGTDQNLGRSIAAVDERFQQAAAAEGRAVEEIRAELQAVQQREGQLGVAVDGAHQGLAGLERMVGEMNVALQRTLNREASAREAEILETLKAIKGAHAVIKGTREEERAKREAFKRELREEMHQETSALREDLEAQIRQMIKPFIVI